MRFDDIFTQGESAMVIQGLLTDPADDEPATDDRRARG